MPPTALVITYIGTTYTAHIGIPTSMVSSTTATSTTAIGATPATPTTITSFLMLITAATSWYYY